MRNQAKMKETVLRAETREADGFHYEYRLLQRKCEETVAFRIPLYAVEVKMSGAGSETTSASTADAFSDAGRAIDFFEEAVENLLTPIDLPYVLEDRLN